MIENTSGFTSLDLLILISKNCVDFGRIMLHTISIQTDILCYSVIILGAQSTLGGHDIFARKICMKN